jgi:glycosylphosphatidylinositol deacylase
MSFPHNLDLSGQAESASQLACKNAASDVILLPSSTNESLNAFDDAKPFSYLQFEMADIFEHQYVAVVEKASDTVHGWTIAEFATGATSSISVSRGHHQLLARGLKLTLPASRPMMIELKIPEVHSTLFAYTFGVTRHPCERFEESFTPLLRQYIAEPYESKYFVNTRGGNINVHGISPYMPPPLRGGGASDGLSLQLWTDPTCNSTVEVSLYVDVLGSAGKLVMRYRTVFAAFPLLVMLIVLRKQFKVYDASGGLDFAIVHRIWLTADNSYRRLHVLLREHGCVSSHLTAVCLHSAHLPCRLALKGCARLLDTKLAQPAYWHLTELHRF